MKSDHTLTVVRLRELLDYDPLTGVFRWRVASRHTRVGAVAGGSFTRGYWRIGVDGTQRMAHRLAWAWVYGVWPAGQVDHRNGNPSDNRIANLREATVSENQQNQHGPRVDNTSGFLGVTRYGEQWIAQITIDGDHRHLGLFSTPEDASAAYLAAKAELHPFWEGILR